MKIQIDSSLCNAHGRCYAIAPDLVAVDVEGYPSIQDAPIEVPAGSEDLADEVVGTCPEGAIRLLLDA